MDSGTKQTLSCDAFLVKPLPESMQYNLYQNDT